MAVLSLFPFTSSTLCFSEFTSVHMENVRNNYKKISPQIVVSKQSFIAWHRKPSTVPHQKKGHLFPIGIENFWVYAYVRCPSSRNLIRKNWFTQLNFRIFLQPTNGLVRQQKFVLKNILHLCLTLGFTKYDSTLHFYVVGLSVPCPFVYGNKNNK